MHIIGAGVGRTGTYSLKLAINELGFGPCHHMEEVLHNMSTQVPLWNDALADEPDWDAIYQGYQSAVDWPTAGFFRQLYQRYPDARFILTHRDPDNWAASFESTIYTLLKKKAETPAEMHQWLEMATEVIAYTGFPSGLNHDQLKGMFLAHNATVKEVIPESQLLVYQVKEGWAPLCEFLDVPVPQTEFPRTNDRQEFWDRVSGK